MVGFMTTLDRIRLNVHDLTPETLDTLDRAGVTLDEVEHIAGRDGTLSGARELRRLEDEVAPDLLDDVRNAFRSEMQRARANAHARGIIHLGMREASSREVDALRRENPIADGGVTAIRPGDPGALATEEGVEAFSHAHAPRGRADDLAALLRSVPPRARDELAALAVALKQAGDGELAVNRLVLSGHSDGDSIRGDDRSDDRSTRISFRAVQELAHLFPEGAARIEHLALSACFCAGPRAAEDFKTAFPNLKSVWGYVDYSPSAERGSPRALASWERMTDGEDASQVDNRAGAVTWNVADGFQGPTLPLAYFESQLDEVRYAWDDYQAGRRTAADAPRDSGLREYYGRLQNLLAHPDLDGARRDELRRRRDEILYLRHPEWRP
jgi:hypothetical protein